MFIADRLNPAYAQQIEDIEKNMHSENAHHYFENILKNRKTVEKLKEIMVKK
jgi:tartrate dehydratase alpha subunit/fumarate hydratase class I-like protein